MAWQKSANNKHAGGRGGGAGEKKKRKILVSRCTCREKKAIRAIVRANVA